MKILSRFKFDESSRESMRVGESGLEFHGRKSLSVDGGHLRAVPTIVIAHKL